MKRIAVSAILIALPLAALADEVTDALAAAQTASIASAIELA